MDNLIDEVCNAGRDGDLKRVGPEYLNKSG
jgi:hypothetical protein